VKRFLFPASLLLAAVTVFAQQYIISDIRYHIEGRTLDWALAYTGELKTGETFESIDELNAYIQRKTQDLKNERVLVDEETRIDYRIGESGGGGPVPVTLDVFTKDTWNFIVLPYPKFDSNEGLSLTLKARDYNFFGTMSPLRVDVGYLNDTDGESFFDIDAKHEFNFEIDIDIPFRAWGFNWNFNFDHAFDYVPGEPLQYTNTTGLSMEYPIKKTTLTFGINQYLFVNEYDEDDPEGVDGDGGPKGSGYYYSEKWYMATQPYINWRIPLGLKSNYGELVYSPGVSLWANYRPGGDIGDYRRGPDITLSHSIGYGQIDWNGNFRDGYSFSVGNSNTYDFYL
jgi:hypothetical protein